MDTPTSTMDRTSTIGFLWGLTSFSLVALLFLGTPKSNLVLLGFPASLNIEL